MEHYILAFDIVTKTPATEAETVLAFPRRDIFELLDLMPASTVVGIAAKSSKGLSLNLGSTLSYTEKPRGSKKPLSPRFALISKNEGACVKE